MPAFAPGQTGGLAIPEPPGGSRAPRIRAAWRLGFFVLALVSACAPISPEQRALTADEAHQTAVFTWLVSHEPSAVVVWRVNAGEVAALIPRARVIAATKRPCPQAKAAHAELLLLATMVAAADRDAAEDCGFALYRDRGAIVVAPR